MDEELLKDVKEMVDIIMGNPACDINETEYRTLEGLALSVGHHEKILNITPSEGVDK